ncbi:transcriptional regulator, Spx/MgsR family [Modicisalibacter muralis]|uniref:Transcriptional regulator, Spx/MgsR family n=1 Tax=Modicisalibacter muralis TaxID=119000 RepID=A0A1G9R4L8_9GAMM|nr:ArsC family reductase [Halomonas muralis]SDM18163.1 transcriptional regulator, Spx/MgsR family [Halomonas muralis]
MITLYGIKTCDTCRKARKALDAQGTAYRYHDLREDGLDGERLDRFIDQAGLQALLNTRSTTWRALDAAAQQAAKQDAASARELMLAQPTLLKRPLLDSGERLIVGFKGSEYASLTD